MDEQTFRKLVIKSLHTILSVLYWKCGGDSRERTGDMLIEIENNLKTFDKSVDKR